MIAGFEEPTTGRVLFDDRDITHDPPNRRDIGLVFQNYALFPHLSVARNIAFGLEVRKIPKAEVRERVAGALQQVQLGGLEEARVDQLSGGQQQRVALARALVIRPRVLLLDEPLSNLDAKLREETRVMLRKLHSSTGVTTIYVTHDQTEAMAMSDRIALLNNGRIQQVATPQEIYERPANRFVAGFIGRNNVLDATVAQVLPRCVTIRFANGKELAIAVEQRSGGLELIAGSGIGVCIRAESLRVSAEGGIFEGALTDIEYAGAVRSCLVKTDAGDLRVEVPGSNGELTKGETVRLDVNEGAVHLVS
jgi:iron(III) transport system ATP-binding protein